MEKWFFEGIVYDLESGLGKVNLEFTGDDSDYTIGDFVGGSNENVSVVFEASCCVRRASLSIIDMVGNAAVKQFYQGPLRDCGRLTLSELNAKGFDLTWNCPCADWPRIDHFNVKVTASDGVTDRDDNYSYENCQSITQTIPGLRSCMQYNVTLTAHAGPVGTEHEVENYRETLTTTLESTPTRPTALTVSSKSATSFNITWMPPIEHKECVRDYRVCYKLLEFSKARPAMEVCNVTQELNFHVEDLEPCAQYRVRVTALTSNGRYSLDATLEDSTELAGEFFNIILSQKLMKLLLKPFQYLERHQTSKSSK